MKNNVLPVIVGKSKAQEKYASDLRKHYMEEHRLMFDELEINMVAMVDENVLHDSTRPKLRLTAEQNACLVLNDAGSIIGCLKGKTHWGEKKDLEKSRKEKGDDVSMIQEQKKAFKKVNYKASLKVGEINADYEHYQRPLDGREKKIAKEWDDSLAREVVVSKRQDGTYWALDGNHTCNALKIARGEDALIACNVYEGLSIEEESYLFHRLNSNFKKPSYNDLLRASRTAGNELVCGYFSALDEALLPYSFSNTRTKFNAHKTLFDCYKLCKSRDRFVLAAKAAVEAADDRAEFYSVGVLPGFIKTIVIHDDLDVQRFTKIVKQCPLSKLTRIAVSKREDRTGAYSVLMSYVSAYESLYNGSFNSRQAHKRLKETYGVK